jgi:membrane-associated phospholipid phosphatase
VSLRWRISSHMLGIGGIIGLIMATSIIYGADIILYLVISMLLAGFIGFSRLSLNAHTPAQVYTGLAVGILVVMLTLLLV